MLTIIVVQYYTKRNQSAGGTVAAFKWDRLYVVLAKLSGLHVKRPTQLTMNPSTICL